MHDHRPPAPSTPVVIVGGGPVGLSLALGLARQHLSSILLESRATPSQHSRAPGIHVRSREVFRQWGIEERFLAVGQLQRKVVRHSAVSGRSPLVVLDYSQLDREADQPGILILEQSETERLLLEAVLESGFCDVRFGAEAVGLRQDASRARVVVRQDGTEYTLDAEFLVGCDGARSFVRNALGLPFEGITYSVRPMLADVRVTDARDRLPWPRTRNARGGLTTAIRLRPGHWRVIRLERDDARRDVDVSEEEVRKRVAEVMGEGPFEVIWASRFRIHLRASPRFRVGRVLLAGDAAHVHSPAGGLGMNGGIQDVHNLAWKLAYALRGGDMDRLLDSYDVERRAVMVESISRYSDLLTRYFLQAPSLIRTVAFVLIRVMFLIPPLRMAWLRRTTMIDLDYKHSPLLNAGARAAGSRLPNPLLHAPDDAKVRLYDLIGYAPTILDVANGRGFDPNLPVEHVIRIGPGGYLDPCELLRGLLGGKDGWIMVRPDAHIAWAMTRREGMEEAVKWALGGICKRGSRK